MTGAAAVVLWTGTLPPAEASWLAGERGPLTGTGCLGSIGCNDQGRIWVDDTARAWLSLLDPAADGACRWAGDGAELQCGGTWYRLDPDGPADG